ncbi:MAG: SPOR domain-containing protein [Methylophilaceae bacterium]|nr:SPOR domain-containing protein [Methylophilaceae bacterium]
MQNDQSDLELIFKKRARRRLVGAIALALLMIIVLPMLLKDRTKMAPQQEIAIVMPGASSDVALNDVVPVEIDGVTAYEEVIKLPTPKTADKPAQNGQPEKVVEVSKSKDTSKEVAKIETKSKVATEKKPAVAKEAATEVTTKSVDNQFYVQIGVFSGPENVKKLQVKLNELGYQPVTEKITTDTGEKTRLRTSNFANKNEAIIALQNIKDAGLTGMVISQK